MEQLFSCSVCIVINCCHKLLNTIMVFRLNAQGYHLTAFIACVSITSVSSLPRYLLVLCAALSAEQTRRGGNGTVVASQCLLLSSTSCVCSSDAACPSCVCLVSWQQLEFSIHFCVFSTPNSPLALQQLNFLVLQVFAGPQFI